MSVINTNIQAIAGARNLNRSQEMLGRALSRLSSGSKIVNPSDDAAGLAVSEKLDAQNKRVRAATTNVQNAVSLVQTSDGFMSGMTKILARMSELAILAKDVTKNASDVALYGKEFSALQEQLRQTIGGTKAQIGGTEDVDTPLGQFNGIKLFSYGSTTAAGSESASVSSIVGRPDAPAASAYFPGHNMSVGNRAVIDGAGSGFGDSVSIGANATICSGALVADGVKVGASAFVGSGVTIESNVTIGENAYVEAGVTLKAGTVVAPGAVVLKSMYPEIPAIGTNPFVSAGTVPAGTNVSTTTLLGSVTAATYLAGTNMTLGSGVVIGTMPVTPVGSAAEVPSISIGKNVSIGDGTRIASSLSNPVSIADDVVIGKNVYVAPGVTISAGVIIPDGAVILEDVDSNYSFGTSGSTSSAGTGATTSSDVPLTVTVGQAVGQTMTIPKIDLRDGGMGEIIKQDGDGNYSLSLTDASAIAKITDAIQDVANERASLGASQSRLELAATTLQVEYENLSSAISRIRDVDVAEESTQYAKYNILVQSGTAMLAQANQMPNSVLKLLQG